MKNGNHTQNGNTTFMNHQMKNEEVRIWWQDVKPLCISL